MARDILDVLRVLASHEAAVRSGQRREPAEVTLHLATGRDLTGRLLDLRDDRGAALRDDRGAGLRDDRGAGPACLFAIAGRREPPQVAYIAARQIVAVFVASDAILEPLAGIEPAAPAAPSPPLPEGTTRLGLLRHARRVEGELGAALGAPIALEVLADDAAPIVRGLDELDRVVELLTTAFASLVADDFARQMLASSVRRIVVRHGASRHVARDGDHLVIETGTTASGGVFADAQQLRDAIDRAC